MVRDGFFLGRSLPGRGGGPDGQLPVHRAEHRHRAGAALRGCPLPQQPLPMEPCLHRGAGERPRLRPAGRPHHRGPQPGAFAGSVGQPLPSPFLGEDARRAGRKQPRQHPSRVGLRCGRGTVPEPGPPRGGGLCGAGRGRAGAELCRGRHPLRRLFLSHHRPGAGRGPVRLQRRGKSGRMAAAECHGAGQGGPRRRESHRCHPPLRGQPAGQPGQRPLGAVQRRPGMADGRGGGGRGGLPLPAGLLGLWLHPPVRQHPLRLREHRARVAGHAPGGVHGPLFRAGGLPCGQRRRRGQRGQPEPVVHRQRPCPAGGRPAPSRCGGDGRSTGTIRSSGLPSRSLPPPNGRRWPR